VPGVQEKRGGTAGDGLRTCDGVVDGNLHIIGRMSMKEVAHIDLRGGPRAVACDKVGGGNL
jgi:hypothetical protein